MSVLIASLLLVVVSTAYAGILHMGPPMMRQPFPQQQGQFQNQFQRGSMIYPEMRHVPMQNFHRQIGNFRHYKPFVPSRPPMWNMQQFPTFQHFKRPFHNGNYMDQDQFPVGGMGQSQFPVGGMGQGQYYMGQGQWEGNVGEGQWNDMPQGQGQWDQQPFGNGDQWQSGNMQQGSFNGQGSASSIPQFPSEVGKDNTGSVTMVGNWLGNEGVSGTGQGINNQGFPSDLYVGNDGFIPSNSNNNNNAFTVDNGNNSPPATGLVQKPNEVPVQSNNLKKKK